MTITLEDKGAGKDKKFVEDAGKVEPEKKVTAEKCKGIRRIK